MSDKRKRRANRSGGDNPYRQADAYTRRAKAKGYAARSVFKLEEIDRRTRVLRQNQRVLDLGAAPGSWSAYAAQQVGKHGVVVAIDLKRITQLLPAQCVKLEGDAFDEALLSGPLGTNAPYDVVLSDMAPNTTGNNSTDKIRSFDLFSRAVDVSRELLAPGGAFVGKIFMSGFFPEAREQIRGLFEKVRVIKPEAVRDVSYEIFLVGLKRRAKP